MPFSLKYICQRSCMVICPLAGGGVLGLAWARLAAIIQFHWSPILLFPALLGAGHGLIVWLLQARFCPNLPRASLLAATLSGGLVLAAGQHYFSYRQYRDNYYQKLQQNPQTQLLRQALGELKPLGFVEFLQVSARQRVFGPWELHGRDVWLSWILDALLTIAAALGVAIWASSRRPPASQIQSPLQ